MGWAEVFRDTWFGILVWLGACAVVFLVAGPVWRAVPLGLWLGCVLIVTMTRMLRRHTLRCSLMYGVHWPLQLGELI
ncbi:hypothetical protein [Streptomyces dubilierae]|uniref:Uncharacterized protein n=1 Tax=Streptomyces dubilierae TaxID=3075533 RepID=A0ABU2PBT2_9ACTN|nr:hypothetical protein [Streptomyces sp. DSM 41921]MDT0388469.1 hypothetical protein [Streptomyces sp. DSM 41921]